MFDIDLAKGNKTELEFIKRILKPWVSDIHMSPDKPFKDYDIKVDYTDWHSCTFEIKNCNRATKSVVFEYEYKWQPSWIFSSKSDYVVYFFDDTFWWQDRWKLITELIEVNKYSQVWWDNNDVKMYIVDKEIAKILFNKFDNEQ